MIMEIGINSNAGLNASTGVPVVQLQAQLAAVMANITAMLTTGKSIQRPGLSYMRVEMKDAEHLRDYLVRQLAREDSGAVSLSVSRSGETNGINADATQEKW